jgi:hypothetical protein
MAKEMAAKVTLDLNREAEAKCRRSSKTRDLRAIEPVLRRDASILVRVLAGDRESSLSRGAVLCDSGGPSHRLAAVCEG